MLEKRRRGRASTKTSIEDEIADLRGLDLKGLLSRWQSVFQRPAPAAHLPRHLLFAMPRLAWLRERLANLSLARDPHIRHQRPRRGPTLSTPAFLRCCGRQPAQRVPLS